MTSKGNYNVTFLLRLSINFYPFNKLGNTSILGKQARSFGDKPCCD